MKIVRIVTAAIVTTCLCTVFAAQADETPSARSMPTHEAAETELTQSLIPCLYFLCDPPAEWYCNPRTGIGYCSDSGPM